MSIFYAVADARLFYLRRASHRFKAKTNEFIVSAYMKMFTGGLQSRSRNAHIVRDASRIRAGAFA